MCRACDPVEAPEERPVSPAYGDKVLNGFARISGLSREALNDAVQRVPDDKVDEQAADCLRCRERPARADSDFCINCQLDLYRALGDASRTLLRRMEMVGEEEMKGARMIVSSIEDKRRFTAGMTEPADGLHLRW